MSVWHLLRTWHWQLLRPVLREFLRVPCIFGWWCSREVHVTHGPSTENKGFLFIFLSTHLHLSLCFDGDSGVVQNTAVVLFHKIGEYLFCYLRSPVWLEQRKYFRPSNKFVKNPRVCFAHSKILRKERLCLDAIIIVGKL